MNRLWPTTAGRFGSGFGGADFGRSGLRISSTQSSCGPATWIRQSEVNWSDYSNQCCQDGPLVDVFVEFIKRIRLNDEVVTWSHVCFKCLFMFLMILKSWV